MMNMSNKVSIIIEEKEQSYYAYCPEIENSRTQGNSFEEVATNIQATAKQYLEKPLKSEVSCSDHKPIWEVIEEIVADLPESVLEKLPVDGAEQHDHYIYGTPKR